MAAFGWSVGDIALAIRFVVRTGQALKDTGGASDDYQESVDFLQGVEATLRNVDIVVRLSPAGTALHSIASQIQRIQSCLKAFMESIEGYEASLGLNRKKGFHRGVWQKSKWAGFVSKRCRELQGKIAFVMSTINTSLGMEVLLLVQQLALDLPSKVCEEVVGSLSRGRIPTQLRSELSTMRQIMDDHQHSSASAQLTIKTLDRQSVDRNLRQLDQTIDSHGRMQTLSQVELLEATTTNSLEIRHLQTVTNASLMHQPTTPVGCHSKEPNPWGELRLHVFKCICLLAVGLQLFFRDLIRLILPYISIYLRKVRLATCTLPKLMKYGDVIFFEDVLGRSKQLPYEYFQHKEIFHAFLNNNFHGLPGGWDVRNRTFVLSTRQGKEVGWQNWQTQLRPNLQVFMSIRQFVREGLDGHCPVCTPSKKIHRFIEYHRGRFMTCLRCNNLYFCRTSAIGSSPVRQLSMKVHYGWEFRGIDRQALDGATELKLSKRMHPSGYSIYTPYYLNQIEDLCMDIQRLMETSFKCGSEGQEVRHQDYEYNSAHLTEEFNKRYAKLIFLKLVMRKTAALGNDQSLTDSSAETLYALKSLRWARNPSKLSTELRLWEILDVYFKEAFTHYDELAKLFDPVRRRSLTFLEAAQTPIVNKLGDQDEVLYDILHGQQIKAISRTDCQKASDAFYCNMDRLVERVFWV